MKKLFDYIRMFIMPKIQIKIITKRRKETMPSQKSIISRLDYEGKYNNLHRRHDKSIVQILVEGEELKNDKQNRKD